MKPWVLGIVLSTLGTSLALGTPVGLEELVPSRFSLPVPQVYTSEGSFIPRDSVSFLWSTGDLSLSTLSDSLQDFGSSTGPGIYLLEFLTPGQSLLIEVEKPRLLATVEVRGYSVQGYREDLLEFRYEYDRNQAFTRGYEYRYNADGRLRSLIETSPTGRVQTQEFQWDKDVLREERVLRNGRIEVRSLTPQGRTETMVVYRNGQITEERRWTFDDNGVTETLVIETYDLPTRIESTYDEVEREVLRQEYRSGVLFSTQRYSYLGTTKELTSFEVQQGSNLRRTVYEYSMDDEVIRTQTFANRTLVQESQYSGLTRVDRFFQGGQEILRITYEDQVKVKEEELRGGQVIRSRSFPSTPRTGL